MNNQILVTFASRGGSTAGVAEAIGKTLTETGADVDVVAMKEVSDLAIYSAIVVGSAVQGNQWLLEATEFVNKHRSVWSQKPTAMFTVCLTLAMKNGENYRPQIAEWMSSVRSVIRPFSEAIFPGVLDISKIPSFGDRLKFRISTLFGVWKQGDHRDWDAIQAWAEELQELLLHEIQ